MNEAGQQLRLDAAARAGERPPEESWTPQKGLQSRIEAAARLAEIDGAVLDPDVDWQDDPRKLTLELGSLANTIWLRGRGAVPIMDAIGCLRQWDHEADTWAIPRRRLADICAAADSHRQRIRLKLVDRGLARDAP